MSEPLTPIPRDLKGCYMDMIALIILILLNLATMYIALAFIKAEDTINLMRIFVLTLFGWGPLFWVANHFTGLRFDFFFSKQDANMLIRFTVISIAGMMLLATATNLLSDKLTMASALWIISSSVGTSMFFGISAAINEEFCMANLQRFLSFGLENELWILIGIVVRGFVFWGMHRPLAYTNAPMAWQLTLFGSGCWLGFVFASTKRFSIVILAHMTWNIMVLI